MALNSAERAALDAAGRISIYYFRRMAQEEMRNGIGHLSMYVVPLGRWFDVCTCELPKYKIAESSVHPDREPRVGP